MEREDIMPDYTAMEMEYQRIEEEQRQQWLEEQSRQEDYYWQQQMEAYYEAMRAEQQEQKQHKIDKEKWPLFFWKEDIK